MNKINDDLHKELILLSDLATLIYYLIKPEIEPQDQPKTETANDLLKPVIKT